MSDFSLGTAQGTIRFDYDGKGINQASQGMDSLQGKARNVQRQFTTVATVTGAAAGVIAGGIAFAVNAAIDFEKELSAIGAVSGATAQQMDALRKKALQLGADTVFSAADAATAMEELVKAGLSVEDVLNGAADATVALAAAGGVDLPQAATIAANAMNQFGLAAKDLPKVADLIAGAANASAIDVSEFGFAMSQAGAIAHLVGVNFQDLAVAIALMGNAGIKGSDAGTSLKTMLANLQPTTKKQISLMREMGLVTEDGSNKFFDQKGKLKSLADVSQILQTSMQGMTAEQKTMALTTIFGSDSIRAAAVLANAGAAGFNNMADAMGKVSATDVAAKRMDNIAGSIEQLKGSVDTAAIALGSALLPAIRKITDIITLLVNKFSALDPKWQKLIAFAAVAAAALLGVIAVIAAVAAAVASMVASIAAIKIALIIGGIVAAVIAIAVAMKVAHDRSAAFRDLLGKLAAVGKAVFGAILAIVMPLANFFKNDLIPAVVKIAKTLMTNLQPAFKAISEFISSRILPAIHQLSAAFTVAMPVIIAIAKVLLTLAGFIINVLGKALGFIIPLLLNIIGPIFSALIAVIAGVISFIPKLVTGFMAVWNVLKIIGEIIAIAVIVPLMAIWIAGKFVFEQLMKVVSAFVAGFMAVWNFLWPITKAVFDLISAIVGAAFAVISGMFQIFMVGVMAIWNTLWRFVIVPVATAVGAIIDTIKFFAGVISAIISGVWDAVRAIFAAVVNWLVPPITSAFGTVSSFISARMQFVRDTVSAIWNAIVGFFIVARDKIVAAINGFSTIIERARSIFQGMKDAAVAKAQELISWVGGLPGRLLGALGNVGGMLFGAGRSLLQGFWDGLKSIWNSIVSWLEDKMSTLRGLWPFSPAKWGPFSGRGWVLYSGRALMEGFAQGMDDRIGLVNDSAAKALASVAGKLPTDFAATVGTTSAGVGVTAGIGNSAASGTGTTSNTSSTVVNINVPLDDLRKIRDVQDLLDFIDRLRNDSRRGLVDA